MTRPERPWSASRPLTVGFLTIALLVGGLGTWSVVTSLAGAIVAPGQVEVTQRRQVVQHPDGGVVEAILVKEGAEVAAGDVVLRLDGSALRSEQVIVETQLMELAARRARLEAQRDEDTVLTLPEGLIAAAARLDVAEMIAGQTSLFARQADALTQAQELRRTRIVRIESQVAGLQAQEAATRTEIALVESELLTLRELQVQGLTPSARVAEHDRELARLQGRQGELTAARAEAAARIAETEIEIAALRTQSRETAEGELRDVAARQLELAERARALAGRIDRLEVRAPASGLVFGLAVTTLQSVIRPAETLMVIIPQGRPLLVAARIPVTHIDEVHPGQNVRLVFATLPARGTPEITGRVTLVSADAMADERTGVTYFRAEIAIDAHRLRDLGGVAIIPGMPVDAFFRTRDRTPLSYLLKPFTDYFLTAFRET